MDTFQKLQEERNKLMKARMEGKSLDFTKFRCAAIQFEKQNNVSFEKETDEKLWKSVNTYFRKLLLSSH